MLGLWGGSEGALSGGPSGTNDEQLKLACFWVDRVERTCKWRLDQETCQDPILCSDPRVSD